MKKGLLWTSIVLFLLSVVPFVLIIVEIITGQIINSSYRINHSYTEQGFPTTINVQEIFVKGHRIEIVEELTGKKGRLTSWDRDEGVEAGDIVKIHLFVNGKEISYADEIWLSNRNRGSRYFSWLDILTVDDKVAIVQRLTDDDVDMNDRKWKIIMIDPNGSVQEEKVSIKNCSGNSLNIELINISGTSLMSIGYYSDILKGYPSLFFPIIYPLAIGILSGFVVLSYLSRRYLCKFK